VLSWASSRRRESLLRAGVSVSILCLVLTACPKRGAVWLTPDADGGKVMFAFGTAEGREAAGLSTVLTVWRCPAANQPGVVMWGIASAYTPSSPLMPSRVEYGVVPDGFQETTPPKPLAAGVYEVVGDGDQADYFLVDKAGQLSRTDRDACVTHAPVTGGRTVVGYGIPQTLTARRLISTAKCNAAPDSE